MSHQRSPSDRRFRSDFDAAGLDPRDFDHRAHIRLAYVYLVEESTAESATAQLKESLLRFLAHHDIEPSQYHETMTKAWILAVRHFMDRSEPASSAAGFIDQNPRLLDSRIMLSHYSADLLFSERARSEFVEPDLQAIPRHE